MCRGPEDAYRVGANAPDYRRSLLSKSIQFVFADLGDSGVVAGPLEDRISQPFDGPAPFAVLFVDGGGPNEEDVYIAIEVPVSPSGGSEDGDVDRSGMPVLKCLAQASEEAPPEFGQLGERFSCDVIPIQPVDPRPSSILPQDQSVGDEAVEHLLGCVLGASSEASHLPSRSRLSGPGEDSENSAIRRGEHGLKGCTEIHVRENDSYFGHMREFTCR
jgi:hypothetical protein